MTLQLPVRRGAQVRRRRPVRRATPRVSSVQIRSVALMAVCLVVAIVAAAGPFFAVRSVRVEGARFTSEAAVERAGGISGSGSPSAFGLQSDRIATELVKLPAVARAHVEVRLPSTLLVTLEERAPRMIWVIGEHRYVLDSAGLLFGEVDEAGRPIASDAGPLPPPAPSASNPEPVLPTRTPAPSVAPSAPVTQPGPPTLAPVPSAVAPPSLAVPSLPARDPAAGLDLPVVIDRLTPDAGLHVGDSVDPTWLDAAFRVASLTPSDVGSTADRLVTTIDDVHGLTLAPAGGGWVADFGVYTMNLRKPDVVPEQVRALRTLFLADAAGAAALHVSLPVEEHVAWVWLMGDVPGGTYSFLPR